MSGKIEVNVQREDRLKAITELSIAIRNVAEALNHSAVVNITGCAFKVEGEAKVPGIRIDSLEKEVTKTEILETKDD